MPAVAVRSVNPPAELADRSFGWGDFGHIFLYPSYGDIGTWPAIVNELTTHELVDEQPETSDARDSGWFRAGIAI